MAEIVMQEKVLFEKILPRLPVKSLIRFTNVCKYWRSVIRSPEFASKHYATRLLSLSPHGCDSLLSLYKPAVSISVLSYNDRTFEALFKFRPAIDHRPPYLGIHHCDVIKDYFIYGPCNGLFVIRLVRPGRGFGNVFLLWNPATREVYKVPSPYIDSYYFRFSFGCLGFGFDPLTNDYKIVCFDTSMSDTKEVILYSLAKNSWKRLHGALDQIDPNMYMARYHDSASSCNARMSHWVLTRLDGGGYEAPTRYTLLSFDMVDELFVQTPVPPLDLDTMTHPCYYAGFLSNHLNPALCFKVNGIDFDDQDTAGMQIWLPLPKRYDPTTGLGLWDKPSTKLPQLLNHWNESPEDKSFIGYTASLFSIAYIASRAQQQPADGIVVPPTIPHELDDDDDYLYDGHIYDNYIYDNYFKDDDYDDDNPFTKRAFLVPQGPSFREFNTVYMSYEVDVKFHVLRKFEWLRLCELPYCLKEVNQPMKSNPCKF